LQWWADVLDGTTSAAANVVPFPKQARSSTT
jgi:hypothetical protein